MRDTIMAVLFGSEKKQSSNMTNTVGGGGETTGLTCNECNNVKRSHHGACVTEFSSSLTPLKSPWLADCWPEAQAVLVDYDNGSVC